MAITTMLVVVILAVTCSVGLMAQPNFNFDGLFPEEFMHPHGNNHEAFGFNHPPPPLPPMGFNFLKHAHRRPPMTADQMKNYVAGPSELFEFHTHSEYSSYTDDNGVKSGEGGQADMVSNNKGVAEAVNTIKITT